MVEEPEITFSDPLTSQVATHVQVDVAQHQVRPTRSVSRKSLSTKYRVPPMLDPRFMLGPCRKSHLLRT